MRYAWLLFPNKNRTRIPTITITVEHTSGGPNQCYEERNTNKSLEDMEVKKEN